MVKTISDLSAIIYIMRRILKKIFGGLDFTWPKVILFAIIMGIYTALMAMLVPDGNSFHDIAVSLEGWILPAILIIVNTKSPLDAAFKTFMFFLISQPLVYLIQVPFNSMGWQLFSYYPYWFGITVLTFPGAFIGWFVKKDEWYSGVILSVMTSLLAVSGVTFIRSFIENPPNHILNAIYCFAIIPVLIYSVFLNKTPRIVASIITTIALIVFIPLTSVEMFETYNNQFPSENHITFVGDPYISFWTGDNGGVDIIKYDEGYTFKLMGARGKLYKFTVADDNGQYDFEYYYDDELDTVVVRRR